MEIKSARFITSMASYGSFPGRGLPQMAVVGRSNVGKSSLINALCRQRNLAKTSGTPGKTRLINVFSINEMMHLIDLPGYGYAKVDKQERGLWGKRMEDYFDGADTLKVVLQLVDIRHTPSQDDLQMVAYLRAKCIPFITVATKADKISRAARQRYLLPISMALQVQPFDIIPWSSETEEGRPKLLSAIESAISA